MVKFHNVSQIEKDYSFVKATAGADMYNGDFGTVTAGTFNVAADAKQVVMNVEAGDNAGLDKYPIAKGEDLRVLDLAEIDGQQIEIYGKQIPAGVAVGDKLKSTATGDLVKGASAVPYLEVKGFIGDKQGILVTVSAVTPAAQLSVDASGKK